MICQNRERDTHPSQTPVNYDLHDLSFHDLRFFADADADGSAECLMDK
jgi:hypothetical protein